MKDNQEEHTGLKGLIFGSIVTLSILKHYIQNTDEINLQKHFLHLLDVNIYTVLIVSVLIDYKVICVYVSFSLYLNFLDRNH